MFQLIFIYNINRLMSFDNVAALIDVFNYSLNFYLDLHVQAEEFLDGCFTSKFAQY